MYLLGQLNCVDLPVENDVGHRVFVDKVDSRLVGTCYLNVIPNLTRGARPDALVENIVTEVHYRNHGVGQALMKHASTFAREAGCYRVMLMTGRNDEAVHSFYQKCGFSARQKSAYIKRWD